LVTPETVVRWHRAGFRLYWKWISRASGPIARRPTSQEVRDLIFRMVTDNPTWGAPRIHGELLMLGFEVSERTVSRWMKRAPSNPEPAKRWLAFLRNHREAIAAMDFFAVPTITFGVLCCYSSLATIDGGFCTSTLPTDLVRRLRVPSLLRNDSAGYTIVTIEPLESQKAGYLPRNSGP